MSWGPSHQEPHRRARRPAPAWMWVLVGVVVLASIADPSNTTEGLAILTVLALGVWRLTRLARTLTPGRWRRQLHRQPQPDPAEVVGQAAGVYLGVDGRGGWRLARPERAVLVLGPPRSGKTSAVIIPTVLGHHGPVVSTSTKADVVAATIRSRSRLGRVWQFDPTGTVEAASGAVRLRWSPVLCSGEWDGALLIARAIVTGARVGVGTTDSTHWAKRAQALLAGLLHAAALDGQSISEVAGWVSRHQLDEPGVLLERHHATPLATGLLQGLANTEVRERSSIFSAAADALDAYSSQAALDAAEHPNFFAARFVRSNDTIYIHAPAEQQQLAAPLVCGLLAEVRRATYQAHAAGQLNAGRVLFALDEVANIAPIAELPQIASEGGSQGLVLLAALQDLSQARSRWGEAADGFLTLFGEKLILPGVADPKTLETVSVTLGEYDRQVVSHTRPDPRLSDVLFADRTAARRSKTYSTQRTRVLSPGEIANIPTGRGLHLDGVRWELLTLTPAHTYQPWRTLTTPTAAGR